MTVTHRAPGTTRGHAGQRPQPETFCSCSISLMRGVAHDYSAGVLLFIQARAARFSANASRPPVRPDDNLNTSLRPPNCFRTSAHIVRIVFAPRPRRRSGITSISSVPSKDCNGFAASGACNSVVASLRSRCRLKPVRGTAQGFRGPHRRRSSFARSGSRCCAFHHPFLHRGGLSGGGAIFAETLLSCPLLHLITGMAFITMLSLSNPARDQLLFPNFAQGIAFRHVAAGASGIQIFRLPPHRWSGPFATGRC